MPLNKYFFFYKNIHTNWIFLNFNTSMNIFLSSLRFFSFFFNLKLSILICEYVSGGGFTLFFVFILMLFYLLFFPFFFLVMVLFLLSSAWIFRNCSYFFPIVLTFGREFLSFFLSLIIFFSSDFGYDIISFSSGSEHDIKVYLMVRLQYWSFD